MHDTPIETPGAQPGQESAPTNPTAGAQPQSGISLENLSENELLDLAVGDTVIPDPTPTPQTPPEEAPPPSAQPDAVLQGETNGQGEDPPASPGSIRVRLSGLPEGQQKETLQALKMVREGQATDILEALQAIRGVQAQDPGAPPDADLPNPANPPANATEAVPSSVSAIQDRLDALRAERSIANREFDSEKVEELTVQIENTLLDLQEAKLQAAQASAAVQSYNDQYEESVILMEQRFPSVLDDTSVFSQLLEDKILAARAKGDPALQNPGFILAFAEEIHDLLETKGKGTPPVAPPSVSKPNGSAIAPVHSSANRPTPDQVAAALENASADEILAAL